MTILLGLFAIRSAAAGTSNCEADDAPTAYWNHQCDGTCAKIGSEWECDLKNLCTSGGGWAIVVEWEGGGDSDYSAWGECDGNNFCCEHVEDVMAEIDSIQLWGTDYDDEFLAFTDVLDSTFPPDPDHLWFISGGEATMHGRAGSDALFGSHTTLSNYVENLFGNSGDDNIWAGDVYLNGTSAIEANQVMNGGMGDDTLTGGGILIGGPGSDNLYGGTGTNDLLCDANGDANGCTPNHGDIFISHSYIDILWYEAYGACTGELDPSSDAGAGDDVCGNDDDFATLPASCLTPTDIKPALCP